MSNTNISTVMKLAPRYLSSRYGSLSSYVWESLFPQDYRGRSLSRIESEPDRKTEYKKMRALSDEATLLVFIFATRRIFQEGTDAAKNTVDTLKELGIEELYLGSTKFSGRNENVMLGERLSNKLYRSLNKDARDLLADVNYIYEIIDHYKNLRKDL